MDPLALRMLQRACELTGVTVDLRPPRQLTSDIVADVAATRPALLCLGAVVPGGVPHLRYLCKQLRARCPSLSLVVGAGGPPTPWRRPWRSYRRMSSTISGRPSRLPATTAGPATGRCPGHTDPHGGGAPCPQRDLSPGAISTGGTTRRPAAAPTSAARDGVHARGAGMR